VLDSLGELGELGDQQIHRIDIFHKGRDEFEIGGSIQTASEVILEDLKDGPELTTDSCFRRYCCGVTCGRIMEGTAVAICAAATGVFFYLTLGPVAGITAWAPLLDGVLIIGSGRWAYVEHERANLLSLQTQITRLQSQVGRLSTEVDRLEPEVNQLTEQNDRLQILNAEYYSSNNCYKELNLELTTNNGELKKRIQEIDDQLRNLKGQNEQFSSANENLKKLVGELGEGQDIWAAMQKVEGDLLKERQELNQTLQEVTRAQEELQQREEDMYKKQQELLEERNSLQEQLEVQIKELKELKEKFMKVSKWHVARRVVLKEKLQHALQDMGSKSREVRVAEMAGVFAGAPK